MGRNFIMGEEVSISEFRRFNYICDEIGKLRKLIMKQCKSCHKEVVVTVDGRCVECHDLLPPQDLTRQILKERGSRYGKFVDNANIALALSDVAQRAINIRAEGMPELKPFHLLALDVIFQKIARILNGDPNYDDNWQDIIGYSQLVLDEIKKPVIDEDDIPL